MMKAIRQMLNILMAPTLQVFANRMGKNYSVHGRRVDGSIVMTQDVIEPLISGEFYMHENY